VRLEVLSGSPATALRAARLRKASEDDIEPEVRAAGALGEKPRITIGRRLRAYA